MKKVLLALLVLSLSLGGQLFADDNGDFAVNKGDVFIGGVIGLNYFGSDLVWGANLEFIVTEVVGIGKIGVGAIFRHWSWDYWGYTWSYNYIGAQGNYHFDFGGKNLDLYAGLTLGYGIFDDDGWGSSTSSGLLWGLHLGARWHFAKALSLTGRISTGGNDFGALEIGLDFHL